MQLHGVQKSTRYWRSLRRGLEFYTNQSSFTLTSVIVICRTNSFEKSTVPSGTSTLAFVIQLPSSHWVHVKSKARWYIEPSYSSVHSTMDRTLLIHHLFTALAIVLMGSRLFCRRIIFGKFDFGDFCTMAAILCAATRGGMIHVVLTWGTNNIPPAVRSKMDFTAVEIYRRTIGSKLTIANRPIYNV
jgi:hypothetical protein